MYENVLLFPVLSYDYDSTYMTYAFKVDCQYLKLVHGFSSLHLQSFILKSSGTSENSAFCEPNAQNWMNAPIPQMNAKYLKI